MSFYKVLNLGFQSSAIVFFASAYPVDMVRVIMYLRCLFVCAYVWAEAFSN